MRFESKKGSKKGEEKNMFCKLKSFFFFVLLFSDYSFFWHLKDDF
jgi:hypothetical protein